MSYTAEDIAKLRLIRTTGVGPVAWRRLLARCGTAVNAVENVVEISAQYRKKPLAPCPMAVVEKELAALHKAGAKLLFWGGEGYPMLLAQVPDAPPVLTVLGNAQALSDKAIAIVGTRNASAIGTNFTKLLAQELAEQGFSIVSGLARGIDTAAHQGALSVSSPSGTTVAVLAGGVDHIYPPENKSLWERVQAGGCIVSELPMGTVPLTSYFPRRNRIIAGLVRAVIVTEASRHSGTLITARHAGEYGREVFAVPGSPADPRAAGTNHLLKQGAQMLETAADVLASLQLHRPFAAQPPVQYTGEASTALFEQEEAPQPQATRPEPDLFSAAPAGNAAELLFTLLSPNPIGVDSLVRQFVANSTFGETAAYLALTDLELDGKIERTATGEVRRV
ncbi:MAG: DNA-processing protein DprA [Alphaproteobacteria bacterium]